MNGATEQAFDDALASALRVHVEECDDADTLDDVLACLALACWTRACDTPDPYIEEHAARERVLAALDFAAERDFKFREARRVFKVFLKGKLPLLGRRTDTLTARLQRTYSLMAMRLFDTRLDVPAHADQTFPFVHPGLDNEGLPVYLPNMDKAADAIVRGLRRLREKQPGLIPHLPTRDAVRQALKRHGEQSLRVEARFNALRSVHRNP
jgi:hypothetical protein